MSDNLSKTISFLRFPLICAVVLIHAQLSDVYMAGERVVVEGDYPIYDVVEYLFWCQLCAIAVPLFFFISGYLFFNSTSQKPIFLKEFYIKKLKSRFRTLFIPYVFWNFLAFVITVVSQYLAPSMVRGDDKFLADYQWQDWLNIFWDYKQNSPANPPFWFLRDLIVMVICSPIIYLIVQKLRIFGVAILGLLFIADLWFTWSIGFSCVAVTFFTFGAFFSLNNLNFVEISRKIKTPSSLIFLSLIICGSILNFMHFDASLVNQLAIIVGIFTVIAWTSIGIEKGSLKVNPFLLASTFFIYAYHAKFISAFKRIFLRILEPSNDLTMIVGYFLLAIITVLFGLLFFKILKTIFPRFTALITGGR